MLRVNKMKLEQKQSLFTVINPGKTEWSQHCKDVKIKKSSHRYKINACKRSSWEVTQKNTLQAE